MEFSIRRKRIDGEMLRRRSGMWREFRLSSFDFFNEMGCVKSVGM